MSLPARLKIPRNEIIAAVDRLAVAGDEEGEHVGGPHLAGKRGEHRGEPLAIDLGVLDQGHLDVLVEPFARLAERLGQRLASGTA